MITPLLYIIRKHKMEIRLLIIG